MACAIFSISARSYVGIGGQAGLFAGFLLQLVQDARSHISRVLHIAQQLQRTGQVVAVTA